MSGSFSEADSNAWNNDIKNEFRLQVRKAFFTDTGILPADKLGTLENFTDYVATKANQEGKISGSESQTYILTAAKEAIDGGIASLSSQLASNPSPEKKASIEAVLTELEDTKSVFNSYISTSIANGKGSHTFYVGKPRNDDAGDGNDFVVPDEDKPLKGWTILGQGNDVFLGDDAANLVDLGKGSDIAIGAGGNDAFIHGKGVPDAVADAVPVATLIIGDGVVTSGKIDQFITSVKDEENVLKRTHALRTFSFEETILGVKLSEASSVSEFAEGALKTLSKDIQGANSSTDTDLLNISFMRGDLEIIVTDKDKGTGYVVGREDGKVTGMQFFIGVEEILDANRDRQDDGKKTYKLDDDSRKSARPTEVPKVAYDEVIQIKY